MIDLPRDEFSSSAEPTQAPAEDTCEAPTAIEPIAATGLDSKPAEAGSSETEAAAVSPTPDEEVPRDLPVEPVGPETVSAVDGAGSASEHAASRSTVPPVAASHPPAREGGGWSSLVAASLLGGVIGAGFVAGADIYWRQPPADFESRLSALETRPRATTPVPSVSQPASDALDRRIAALEQQSAGVTEAVAAVRAAAEANQKQVAELLGRPAPEAGAQAPVAPPPPDPALREGIDRLGSRLDGLESRLGQAAPAAAVDEIRTGIQAVQTQSAERQRATDAALAAAQNSRAELDGKLAANGEQLARLTAEVGKLPPTLLQAGLRAVVAGQIGQDLRNGVPLAPALAALERLGAEPASLDALRPYGAQPAPEAPTLAAEFRPIAEKITAEPQGPTGSLADRLLRVADKIVTVRVIGDGSGGDVPGLVGRIETALARGNLQAAAAAWDSLPDAAKRLAPDWGARLKSRVAAETAAQKLGTEALAALDAPSR